MLTCSFHIAYCYKFSFECKTVANLNFTQNIINIIAGKNIEKGFHQLGPSKDDLQREGEGGEF